MKYRCTAGTHDWPLADMFERGVVDAAVEVLAELAGGGRALELGIGTGRIALPLARRGVAVHGIDLSRAMVSRLRAKPGADERLVKRRCEWLQDCEITRIFRVKFYLLTQIGGNHEIGVQGACIDALPQGLFDAGGRRA